MRPSVWTKKHCRTAIASLVFALILMVATGYSQAVTTLVIDDPDEVMNINEFGGLIVGMNDTVTVQMVFPEDQRADAYKALDIRFGDIIKMVNGKTITSVKPLKEIYDNATFGEIIKLGILRDGKMKLLKFEKADPEVLPNNMQITMDGSSEVQTMTTLFIDGMMISTADNNVVISDVISNMSPEFTGYTPAKGDYIVQLQGKEISSPDEFDKIYESIKQGDMVKLKLLSGDKEKECSYIKPAQTEQQTIIQKAG